MRLFEVQVVDWQEAAPQLARVRRAVFIEEQGVPEALEWDGEDAAAVHVLARAANGEPIGSGRLLMHGGLAHIGRMAVVKPWRGRGVGSALLARLLSEARRLGCREAKLSAQTHALPFYARFGFRPEGEVFLDAGIPHRRMRRLLSQR
jgi:predicted GNAT family N-acyltransferase